MPNNFPGTRTHGATQETQEMDVAWQELMAITELQVTLQYSTDKFVMENVYSTYATYCMLAQEVQSNGR